PIDYSIAATRKTISPSLRSGAVVDFAVTKLQAFTGYLKYQQAGATNPVEFQEITIEVAGGKQTFQTGRGGEFYIENLKPGTYAARAESEGQRCLFDLIIPASSETFVELGDVQCRRIP